MRWADAHNRAPTGRRASTPIRLPVSPDLLHQSRVYA
jgi:hypothetical protein